MIIVACEIGFWVLIALGLVARYPLRRRRTGLTLLALTPVVDLVLLATTVVDLRGGATAGTPHALAAVYLGLSVAYGHAMIRWADVRFAHRFADGPAPERLHGMRYAAKCWKDVVRTALAVGIAAGIIQVLVLLVDDAARTEALTQIYPVLGIVAAADLLWAASYTVWPKTPKTPKAPEAREDRSLRTPRDETAAH
ncbi:hypothetical protein JAV76_11515 [Sanguibacter sp. YZGR15]|uniref:Uncharacterized protein n=2 Tax=Sanguibacter suaedae TaxID=2795737 RepID=A0A934IC29_9MICO|nr:hypothetical protein [Sanguibacter suaedae]MBI9115642.1 hypothetical protein [Sanguibacter suaedae]